MTSRADFLPNEREGGGRTQRQQWWLWQRTRRDLKIMSTHNDSSLFTLRRKSAWKCIRGGAIYFISTRRVILCALSCKKSCDGHLAVCFVDVCMYVDLCFYSRREMNNSRCHIPQRTLAASWSMKTLLIDVTSIPRRTQNALHREEGGHVCDSPL